MKLMQRNLSPILIMWSNLPYDLLANIFSFLSPDSLARASSACRNWNTCSKAYASVPARRHHLPWFIALPTRRRGQSCYAHNPVEGNWHSLSLDFVPDLVRPIASIGGVVLLKQACSTSLQLAICNPFTRQFKPLPMLNTTRTNPAVGVIHGSSLPKNCSYFRIYVAGGMSELPGGGASYEPTLEMYDSQHDTWSIIGTMPVEFAVRLTVWTPNESVYSNGVLYWITSARAYSVMGFEIGPNTWRELSVPMSDQLEFATLVQTNERLTVVGGICGGDACVWELGDDDYWSVIGRVPYELRVRFLGGKGSWGNTKCVGVEGGLWLYRDLWSGMVVWRENLEVGGMWEWIWVEGCCSIKGKQIQNFPIRGVVLHPNLAPSCRALLDR